MKLKCFVILLSLGLLVGCSKEELTESRAMPIMTDEDIQLENEKLKIEVRELNFQLEELEEKNRSQKVQLDKIIIDNKELENKILASSALEFENFILKDIASEKDIIITYLKENDNLGKTAVVPELVKKGDVISGLKVISAESDECGLNYKIDFTGEFITTGFFTLSEYDNQLYFQSTELTEIPHIVRGVRDGVFSFRVENTEDIRGEFKLNELVKLKFKDLQLFGMAGKPAVSNAYFVSELTNKKTNIKMSFDMIDNNDLSKSPRLLLTNTSEMEISITSLGLYHNEFLLVYDNLIEFNENEYRYMTSRINGVEYNPPGAIKIPALSTVKVDLNIITLDYIYGHMIDIPSKEEEGNIVIVKAIDSSGECYELNTGIKYKDYYNDLIRLINYLYN